MWPATRLRRRLAAAAVGGAAAYLVVFGVLRLSSWLTQIYSVWALIAADLLPVTAMLLGASVGYCLRVQDAAAAAPPRRLRVVQPVWFLVALVVLGYGVTWTFGIPAVTSTILADAVADQRRLMEARAARGVPLAVYTQATIVTRVGFAPLPGVVVVHAETRGGGTCDWCGWSVSLWAPGSVRHLGTKLNWIT